MDDEQARAIRVVVAAPFTEIVGIHERTAEYADQLDVCGVISSGNAVVEQTRLLQPEVLLLSEGLGVDAADAASRLAALAPTTRLVVLVAAEGRSPIAGVDAELDPGASAAQLRDAIVTAAGHGDGRVAPAAHGRAETREAETTDEARWFWEMHLPRDPEEDVAERAGLEPAAQPHAGPGAAATIVPAAADAGPGGAGIPSPDSVARGADTSLPWPPPWLRDHPLQRVEEPEPVPVEEPEPVEEPRVEEPAVEPEPEGATSAGWAERSPVPGTSLTEPPRPEVPAAPVEPSPVDDHRAAAAAAYEQPAPQADIAVPIEAPAVPWTPVETAPMAAAPVDAGAPPSAPEAADVPVSAPIPDEVALEEIAEQPRVRTRSPGRTRAQTVMVFSGKGGVGKSVVSSNLAVGLSTRGAKVAVIDLNLQYGDMAVMLHVEGHPNSIESLAQQGEHVDHDFLEEVMATGPEEVRILLAPSSPEFADLVTAANLRAIIRELSRGYDFIVVDSPAHLEERVLEVMEIADQILVVTSFAITSVKDTKVTLKLLQSLGIERDRMAVVLNQTKQKVGFSRDEIERSLRFRALALLPFEPRVDDSIDSGRPIAISEPRSEFSKQLRTIIDYLAPEAEAERGEAGRQKASKRRLFNR